MLPPLIHTLTLPDLEQRWAKRRLRGVYRVADTDYHGGPGLSSTGVKRLLETPAHFKAPPPSSDAMEFGIALHMALLEPERFAERYIFKPEGMNFATKEGKAWQANAGDKEILTAAEAARIQGIVQACGRSQRWSDAVAGAELEIAAFHQDGPALRKAKADIFAPDGIIYDLKSIAGAELDSNRLGKEIADRDYHISAAWYLDVFGAALGVKLNRFVWVFASKAPPYAIRFVPITAEMLRIGRLECARAQALYVECMKTDTWPAYPDEFVEVELPAFYTKRFA